MDNTVSINTNVTVDNYQVIDDLNIIDEAVQVNIVDALFTSTQPDWDVNDPDSPYFIKHKPTKTSEFINDGADGTSRYVEYDELTDLNRVNDVQVKTSGTFASVVIDKIAKIDLSNYVVKEFKTGSSSAYKVLSDNNFTDAEKIIISYLKINGDGSQALTNNGSYKDLYNILRVNGVEPVNKEIIITPENLEYNNGTLKTFLDKTVVFNAADDRSITLDNNKYLYGKTSLGNSLQLLGVNSNNVITIGDASSALKILTNGRIIVDSNSIAYLADITESIEEHNTSEEAHADIRADISEINSHLIMRMTNAEIDNAITEGTLPADAVVVPTDEGTYTAGKIYKYVNNTLTVLSNYQVENIYRNTSPNSSSVGVVGQLWFNVVELTMWRCMNSTAPYDWRNITPVTSGDSQLLQQVINNTQIISDANGGFTAGNNYLLLDSNGVIPIERIPQAVLQGMTYGGSFDGNGIITASSSAQAIDGQVIDTVNKAYYKNYYFLATATYVLDGVTYIAGNFALSSGAEWVKIANSGQVVSVNGYDGAVVLTYTDVNAIGDDKLVTSWGSTTSNDNVPSEKLVKDSLDGKQDTLTTAQQNAVDSGITSSLVTQIGTNQTSISNINALIPSQATDQNQLADKDFVNSSINALAAFYITRNVAGDPFRTKAELDGTSTYYSGGQVRIPTTNDYCIVLADITRATAVSGYSSFTTTSQYVGYHIIYNYTDTLVTDTNKDSLSIVPGTTVCYYKIPTTRYSYQGSQWEFQYIVNDTSLTAAQLAALNSGITTSLVAQITANANNISALQQGTVTNVSYNTSTKTLQKTVNSQATDIIAIYNTTTAGSESVTINTNTLNVMTRDTQQTVSGRKSFNSVDKILPTTTASYDIGSSSNFWRTLYLSGNLSDGTNSISISGIVNKANKTSVAEYTLYAASWVGNNYTLGVTGKSSSNNALVSNSNSGTDQQVLDNAEAITDANIYKIVDNGNSLTFTCETVPTVDLKIQVEVYD